MYVNEKQRNDDYLLGKFASFWETEPIRANDLYHFDSLLIHWESIDAAIPQGHEFLNRSDVFSSSDIQSTFDWKPLQPST